MLDLSATLQVLANGSRTAGLDAYVTPIVQAICVLASLICVFFIISGGIQYITSSGHPDKLASAKKILKNAVVGLLVVLAAGTITTIFASSYHQLPGTHSHGLPTLGSIQPSSSSDALVEVILKAITGILADIVQSIAVPFINALAYFTAATPLISQNVSVFNVWLAIVGISDALFVLVVALLGLHIMSYATFGLDEMEFKQLLPQIGLVFLLMNTSVFLIDGLIGLSNAMISAIRSGLGQSSVWSVLSKVADQSGGYGLAALLILVLFMIFSGILLVYYVGRIVTIYIGAVLSPLVLLVWLIPSFRDFASSAAKTYISNIFVLFVHVVILELAASIFAGISTVGAAKTTDPIMAMIVGLAVLIALLKTQGVMMQLSYASIGPRTARKLGGQFINSISYVTGRGADSPPLTHGFSGSITGGRSFTYHTNSSSISKSSASSVVPSSVVKISSNSSSSSPAPIKNSENKSTPRIKSAPKIERTVPTTTTSLSNNKAMGKTK